MDALTFISVIFATICITVLGVCFIAIKYNIVELEKANKKLTDKLNKLKEKSKEDK